MADSDNTATQKTPQKRAEDYNKNFEDRTPPDDVDNAVEGIGKAITAPVRDAADEGSDKVPGQK